MLNPTLSFYKNFSVTELLQNCNSQPVKEAVQALLVVKYRCICQLESAVFVTVSNTGEI
jgi:hypothetical protein